MVVCEVVPDAVCVLLCLVAAVTDVRERKIPNWLTASGVAAGLLLNALIPALTIDLGTGLRAGLLPSVVGCLLLLLVFGLFGAIRFVGMGDVKLMAAVGALLRWPTALLALAYVTLAGGVIAVVFALRGGWLGQVLRNLFVISRGLVKRDGSGKEAQLHRIPYAVAILVGAAWAVAAKYLPVLRLGLGGDGAAF